MLPNSVRKDEQIKLIMECRQSGLSDYQWCKKNDIKPGTFYNWVSKLRKKGYTFPESESKSSAMPVPQEVVKLSVSSEDEFLAHELIEQNTNHPAASDVAAVIQAGAVTIKLLNGADPDVIRCTLQCIGGITYAR